MNKTYNEILEEMKCAYFNHCSQKPEDNQSVLKRLEAVASELYALSCYGDYIFKQAFIQTATGENLDRHAMVRNCERKTASKARGVLTFYVDEPAAEKIIIAQNTVCSVENKPYIQFATVEKCEIDIGETSVSVNAQALDNGYAYNVEAGKINVLVNAPVGISRVENINDFTGGYDEESDSSLRDRIMKNYSIKANGINSQSVANSVLLLDFVTDCYIPYTDWPGSITVSVATKDNSLSEEQTEEIQRAIGLDDLFGTTTDVVLAEPQSFSLVVEANVRAGFNKDEIESKITEAVNEISSACRVGRALGINTVSKKLISIEGISSYNVYSSDAYGEVIPCNRFRYLFLDDLVVNCFDE